jgi:hypothetical protein
MAGDLSHEAEQRSHQTCVSTAEEGSSMYIGLGTLVLILVIVMIIYFVRRA